MKKILIATALIVLQAAVFSAFACTTAIVGPEASKSGKPMIWKQRDTDSPSNVMVYIPATETTMAYTALYNSDDIERSSVYGGQNTAGFAVLNNMSYNIAATKYSPKNGTVMRLALESCTTVDEFEAMLIAMSPRNCSANFAVLDATGACAYIEAADSTVARYDVPADGWLVRSNYSFAGREEGPSGYARYVSAYRLMKRHHGKFTPSDLIDGLGRSFYNSVLGYDASKWFRRRYVYDEDFIARPSTTASICIDGDQIWAAVGYTAGTIMIPFKVGEDMPSCIQPSEEYGGGCATDALATNLKALMHPLPRDAANKYIDFKVFRRIRKTIRIHERKVCSLIWRGESSASRIDELFGEFKSEVLL